MRSNSYSCPLYPCFDTQTGASFKKDKNNHIFFDCRRCTWAQKNQAILRNIKTQPADSIESLYFLKTGTHPATSKSGEDTSGITDTLKKTKGIKKSIHILEEAEKEEALEIEKHDKHQNIGVYSALKRDIAIACAHDSSFRPPPIPIVLLVKERKIIGEMTDNGPLFYKKHEKFDCVLPPIDFPELGHFGKDVTSSSPGAMLDKWLREKIKIKEKDATLIIGLNLKR